MLGRNKWAHVKAVTTISFQIIVFIKTTTFSFFRLSLLLFFYLFSFGPLLNSGDILLLVMLERNVWAHVTISLFPVAVFLIPTITSTGNFFYLFFFLNLSFSFGPSWILAAFLISDATAEWLSTRSSYFYLSFSSSCFVYRHWHRLVLSFAFSSFLYLLVTSWTCYEIWRYVPCLLFLT